MCQNINKSFFETVFIDKLSLSSPANEFRSFLKTDTLPAWLSHATPRILKSYWCYTFIELTTSFFNYSASILLSGSALTTQETFCYRQQSQNKLLPYRALHFRLNQLIYLQCTPHIFKNTFDRTYILYYFIWDFTLNFQNFDET